MTETRLRVLVLNAGLLPGAGHIYIKRHLAGVTLAAVFTVSSLTAIVIFAQAAWAALHAPHNLFNRLTEGLSDGLFLRALGTAALVWLLAVADSFRITRP